MEPRSLAGDGAWYLIAGAVQMVVYLLAMPFITRLLGTSDFGDVVLALVVFQALAAVATFGLGSVVAWDIYDRHPDGVLRSIRLIYSAATIALGVVILATVTGPLWVRIFDEAEFGPVFVVAVWLVLPTAVQASCLTVLQAQGRPRAPTCRAPWSRRWEGSGRDRLGGRLPDPHRVPRGTADRHDRGGGSRGGVRAAAGHPARRMVRRQSGPAARGARGTPPVGVHGRRSG